MTRFPQVFLVWKGPSELINLGQYRIYYYYYDIFVSHSPFLLGFNDKYLYKVRSNEIFIF